MTTMSDAAVDASSRAFTFGPPERALFGWYHPPRATPRNAAVLLCSPAGWEALTTQRTYRALAERLSDAGFATLRFDLDGTGDSAGSDQDPERVEAWLRSIGHAAAQLRTLSGLERVSLFGCHLGATLAAQVAATEGGVSTAVLWAPFLQGKQLSRQIRAYGALSGREASSAGDQDAGGFLYRAETLDALSKLDLVKLAPAAPRVLLLRKDASSREELLAAAWRKRGAEVTCDFFAEYDDMMQESRKSQIPDQLIEHVVGWLSAQHPVQVEPVQTAIPYSLSGVREPFVVEELCVFGPGAQFFGILTRAIGHRDGPTLVFLNTSYDYRVGPNRMFVPWSRELARLGMTSFRFDPTGVGDHRGTRVDEPSEAYADSRLRETTVVLDFLESQGLSNRFILIGLCSGAYIAFQAAVQDDRVVGTVLINPQTLTWKPGDSLELIIRESFRSPYYRRAIRKFMTWCGLSGQVDVIGIGRTLAKRVRVRVVQIADHVIPSRVSSEFRVDRGFKLLLDRGARVLLIFGDENEAPDVFNGHVGKDGGYLRRYPRFRFETAGGDHTFSRVQDQRTLFALLRDYLSH